MPSYNRVMQLAWSRYVYTEISIVNLLNSSNTRARMPQWEKINQLLSFKSERHSSFFKRSQPIRKSFEWNPNLCFHCIILSVVMQRDNTQNVRLLLTQKIRDEGDCEMRIQKDFNKTYFKEFWIRFENSRMPRLDSNFWGAQSREPYFCLFSY